MIQYQYRYISQRIREKKDALWNTNVPARGKFHKWPSLSNSNVKVTMQNIKVTVERSCHKEHIYMKYKSHITYHSPDITIGEVCTCRSNFKVRTKRLKIKALRPKKNVCLFQVIRPILIIPNDRIYLFSGRKLDRPSFWFLTISVLCEQS
jgi:hypothetical protein